jgi:hypothetical protein
MREWMSLWALGTAVAWGLLVVIVWSPSVSAQMGRLFDRTDRRKDPPPGSRALTCTQAQKRLRTPWLYTARQVRDALEAINPGITEHMQTHYTSVEMHGGVTRTGIVLELIDCCKAPAPALRAGGSRGGRRAVLRGLVTVDPPPDIDPRHHPPTA